MFLYRYVLVYYVLVQVCVSFLAASNNSVDLVICVWQYLMCLLFLRRSHPTCQFVQNIAKLNFLVWHHVVNVKVHFSSVVLLCLQITRWNGH